MPASSRNSSFSLFVSGAFDDTVHEIVADATKVLNVVDEKGRNLSIRLPTALDTLRLFKAAGPVLAQNEPWLSMASLAYAVTEIDSVPVPPPASESQIESLVDRLGDAGLVAVSEAFRAGQHERGGAGPGNLPSTRF